MRVLIIGCNGFIGNNLAVFLSKKGFKVHGCDLTEYAPGFIQYFKTNLLGEGVDIFLENNPIDVCINAGGSGNVGYSMEQPMADFGSNTEAVMRILNHLRILQPQCKYLHISSAAIYGNPSRLPVAEDANISPLSPYGFHKWMSEIICREYHQLYQLPIAVIRPFSVYGNGLRKQLLWDICQKLRQGNSISLFGTGEESRDFIHISDLVELMLQVIGHSPFQNNVYNAASGTETSIRAVADIFESLYPGQKKISFSGETKKGDPLQWKADILKALELGFEPKMPLAKGIRDYINWYASQPHE